MKAVNPYEASAEPSESSRADSSGYNDNPSKANEFDLTSYGVLATAIILGLFAIRLVIGGGMSMWLCITGLVSPPDDGSFSTFEMFGQSPMTMLGRGATRLVLGILALCVVWHCRRLFQELRAVSSREATEKALVQPQRKCWTLLGIFLFLCGIVLIFGPFFFGMYL